MMECSCIYLNLGVVLVRVLSEFCIRIDVLSLRVAFKTDHSS
jgi:hypothetical protein